MKNVYTCPHCDSVLNPSVKIVLVASYGRQQGLILLSPLLGNYRFVCDRSVHDAIDVGARVKFSCPVCSADLTAPGNKDFAELALDRPGETPRRVQFSRQYGMHATFLIDGDAVAGYGDDSDEFDPKNFFGV